MPVALLLQAPVPPLKVVFDKVEVAPIHVLVVPVIVPEVGIGLTVKEVVVESVPQPIELVTVKVMVAEPALTPYTRPVVGLTVAILVALLLHATVPPVKVVFDNAEVAPTQAFVVPVMEPAVGVPLTVTVVVTTVVQPKPLVTE